MTEGVCSYFLMTGQCRYGNKCKLLHEEQTQVQPRSNSKKAVNQQQHNREHREGSRNAQPVPSNKGTKPCKFFAESGACRRGDQCNFAHILREPGQPAQQVKDDSASETPSGSSTSKPKVIRKRPCRFFQKDGNCTNGDKCTFLHIAREATTEAKEDTSYSSEAKSSQSNRNHSTAEKEHVALDAQPPKADKVSTKTSTAAVSSKPKQAKSNSKNSHGKKSEHTTDKNLSKEQQKQPLPAPALGPNTGIGEDILEGKGEPSNTKKEKKEKTKPCRYFNSTVGCKSGDNCKFAHVTRVPKRKPHSKSANDVDHASRSASEDSSSALSNKLVVGLAGLLGQPVSNPLLKPMKARSSSETKHSFAQSSSFEPRSPNMPLDLD